VHGYHSTNHKKQIKPPSFCLQPDVELMTNMANAFCLQPDVELMTNEQSAKAVKQTA
jgi:hypothetical protein